MKIILQCREQARRVYYNVVFEIKKEIPSKEGSRQTGLKNV
jgi:hypothetical protein